jgi:hypothetical protein
MKTKRVCISENNNEYNGVIEKIKRIINKPLKKE